jgi:Tfp pilus assembly protein PilP
MFMLAWSLRALAQAADVQPPATGATYVYRSEGRRDPFVSLVNTRTAPRRTSPRADGPAGFMAAELSVRGVLESRNTLVAMIQGPDGKTYLVRSGDRLADGVISAVIREGLVILQEVDDPTAVARQREMRRLLPSAEKR